MTLQEAIEIISEEVKHPYSAKKMCRPDALKLLIEAGKRLEEARTYPGHFHTTVLPGETTGDENAA